MDSTDPISTPTQGTDVDAPPHNATAQPHGGADESLIIPADSLVLDKRIGAGTYGDVWRARRGMTDVAVKIFRHKNHSVLREAWTLAKLRHPNIVQFLGYGYMPDGSLFIVTEYLNGGDLYKAVVQSQVSLADSTKLHILSEVAKALEHMHAAGFGHGDLKLANIVFSHEGRVVKVADFGLAFNTLTNDAHNTAGTLTYVAPETRLQGICSERSDVFCFGVVLYEVLAGGASPWLADRADNYYQAPRPLPSDAAARPLAQALWPLVLTCLSAMPEKRPSFCAVLAELSRAAKHIALGHVHASVPPLPEALVPLAADPLPSLLDSLLRGSERVLALHGATGVGKTTLALRAAHAHATRVAFSAGIYWLSLGPAPQLTRLCDNLLRELGAPPPGPCTDVAQAQRLLHQASHRPGSERLLLVLERCWRAADAAPLLAALPSQARALVTTRSAEIAHALAPAVHELAPLGPGDALVFLARELGLATDALDPAAPALLRLCGGFPLALKMVAATLRSALQGASRAEASAGDWHATARDHLYANPWDALLFELQNAASLIAETVSSSAAGRGPEQRMAHSGGGGGGGAGSAHRPARVSRLQALLGSSFGSSGNNGGGGGGVSSSSTTSSTSATQHAALAADGLFNPVAFALTAALDALGPLRHRFYDLAVFPSSEPLPPSALAALWSRAPEPLSLRDGLVVLRRFLDAHLLEQVPGLAPAAAPAGAVVLPDFHRLFLLLTARRRRAAGACSLRELHRRLVAGYARKLRAPKAPHSTASRGVRLTRVWAAARAQRRRLRHSTKGSASAASGAGGSGSGSGSGGGGGGGSANDSASTSDSASTGGASSGSSSGDASREGSGCAGSARRTGRVWLDAGPDDGYYISHVVFHLLRCGETYAVSRLLSDWAFVRRRIALTGVAGALADIAAFADALPALVLPPLLSLLRKALWQSLHASAFGEQQIALQLYGRLVRSLHAPRCALRARAAGIARNSLLALTPAAAAAAAAPATRSAASRLVVECADGACACAAMAGPAAGVARGLRGLLRQMEQASFASRWRPLTAHVLPVESAQVRMLRAHASPIIALRLSSCGHFLATLSAPPESLAKLYDWAPGLELWALAVPGAVDVALCQAGALMLVTCGDGACALYDTRRKTQLHAWVAAGQGPWALCCLVEESTATALAAVTDFGGGGDGGGGGGGGPLAVTLSQVGCCCVYAPQSATVLCQKVLGAVPASALHAVAGVPGLLFAAGLADGSVWLAWRDTEAGAAAAAAYGEGSFESGGLRFECLPFRHTERVSAIATRLDANEAGADGCAPASAAHEPVLQVFTASDSGSIWCWALRPHASLADGAAPRFSLCFEIPARFPAVLDLCFVGSLSQFLVSTATDELLSVHSALTGERVVDFQAGAMRLAGSGGFVCCTGFDPVVRVFDLSSLEAEAVHTPEPPSPQAMRRMLSGSVTAADRARTSIDIVPPCAGHASELCVRFVSGTGDGFVALERVGLGSPLTSTLATEPFTDARWRAHGDEAVVAVAGIAGGLVVSCGRDRNICLFTEAGQRCDVRRMERFPRAMARLAATSGAAGEVLFLADHSGGVTQLVIDTARARIAACEGVAELQVRASSIAAFCSTGAIVVCVGTHVGDVLVLGQADERVDALETQRVLRGHVGCVLALAMETHTGLLASAAEDRTVRLWDLARGTLVAVVTGHSAEVTDVLFSCASPPALYSASWDDTVRVTKLTDVGAAAESGTLLQLRSEVCFVFDGSVRCIAEAATSDGAQVALLAGLSSGLLGAFAMDVSARRGREKSW